MINWIRTNLQITIIELRVKEKLIRRPSFKVVSIRKYFLEIHLKLMKELIKQILEKKWSKILN